MRSTNAESRALIVPFSIRISKEAAKKHLAEIYRMMQVGRWDELVPALRIRA